MSFLDTDHAVFKHARHRRIQWIVSHTKKRDEDGELRHLFYGLFLEALPRGTDTPAGLYHNEPVHSSLGDRYYARRGQHVRNTP